MKLKNEIEYVFRILNYLSLQDKDRIVTSAEIAEMKIFLIFLVSEY